MGNQQHKFKNILGLLNNLRPTQVQTMERKLNMTNENTENLPENDLDQYFDQHCYIKYKSSIVDKVQKDSKRETRLLASEPLLMDGSLLKFSSIINLANQVEPGAAGKRLLYVGIQNNCWEIVNSEGSVLDADFVDSKGHLKSLTPRLT